VQLLSAKAVTAADVNEAMNAMQESQLALTESAVAHVEKICNRMQLTVSESLETIVCSVHNMQASLENFNHRMLSVQQEMRQDLQNIAGILADECQVKKEDLDGLGNRLILVCPLSL
jgi:2C-methyl-D-erythritol 2,4-cyclodiphosphate synthase